MVNFSKEFGQKVTLEVRADDSSGAVGRNHNEKFSDSKNGLGNGPYVWEIPNGTDANSFYPGFILEDKEGNTGFIHYSSPTETPSQVNAGNPPEPSSSNCDFTNQVQPSSVNGITEWFNNQRELTAVITLTDLGPDSNPSENCPNGNGECEDIQVTCSANI